MIQTIHELENPFDCQVQYSDGSLVDAVVLFLIAGSIHSNPQFIVKLYNTGLLRTVDQNDLRVYGNPSNGETLIPCTK